MQNQSTYNTNKAQTVRLSDFDTIIFDFGGVILDICPDLSRMEFAKMFGKHNAVKLETSGLMQEYEKGQMDKAGFAENVRKITGANHSDEEIVKAWCAMLLEYKEPRIEWIKRLRNTHKLLMLSNTNDSHFEYFHNKLQAEYGVTFYDLFDHVYLSHEMHLLKPSHEIFQAVIDEQKLDPSRTLFIEDTEKNAVSAQEVGLKTLVIPRNGNFYEFFE